MFLWFCFVNRTFIARKRSAWVSDSQSIIHEFHETCHSVTFIVLVNSHQRWKQTRHRVCFHLWCELTPALWCQSIVWSSFSWIKMQRNDKFHGIHVYHIIKSLIRLTSIPLGKCTVSRQPPASVQPTLNSIIDSLAQYM